MSSNIRETYVTHFQKAMGQPMNAELNVDLLKLAGTVNPKCRKAAVEGGRMGFQDGLSTEFCINEGKKISKDLVAKNIKGSPAQNSIMKTWVQFTRTNKTKFNNKTMKIEKIDKVRKISGSKIFKLLIILIYPGILNSNFIIIN